MDDEQWMKRALRLAEKGRGRTSPNPMVGAVLVKEGKVVGEGYHAKAGEAHAEIVALQQAGEEARGASSLSQSGTLHTLWKDSSLCSRR